MHLQRTVVAGRNPLSLAYYQQYDTTLTIDLGAMG
jgi:hypothetical protein